MSNTVTPRFYTAAFPLITVHSLKYVLYKNSDPTVEVASQTFAAPHPERQVSFPGLLRTNYIFKLLEMNGVAVVAQRAIFNFVPDNADFKYKAPMEVQEGVTPGVVAGATSFTMDSSGGSSDLDWRSWNIYVERVGQGTMQRNVQYSWDETTGIFTLLQMGDTIQPGELFNVEFELQVTNSSAVPVVSPFKGKLVITNTTILTADDAGKKIIIKGSVPYFVITLPDLTLTEELIPFYFESGIGAHKCVRLAMTGGQIIDWGKGAMTDIKMGVCENIDLYKEHIDPSTDEWRVQHPYGNFLTVGRIIASDADLSVQEFNCLEMDGSDTDVNQYARLYEDFVQKLPPSQVVNYVDWATGDNKYKWSYASGGVFKRPDRRNLYQRNTDGALLPGIYQGDQLHDHKHEETIGLLPAPLFGRRLTNRIRGTYNGTFNGQGDLSGSPLKTDGTDLTVGTETRVKSYITRQFVLV